MHYLTFNGKYIILNGGFLNDGAITTVTPIPPIPPTATTFPLTLSGNHLVDASGTPFLIIGDSPWSLIVGPKESSIAFYIDNRAAKGINAFILNAIESYYNGPADASGYLPFQNMTTPFINPSENYWRNVDFTINYCASKGIAAFLNPAYLGYDDGGNRPEGWWSDVSNASLTTMSDYGKFLGNRYKNTNNIIWVIGGDSSAGKTQAKINAMVASIEASSGKAELFTAHDARYVSSYTNYDESWLDFQTAYSGNRYTARDCSYNMRRGEPYVYYEGHYEGYDVGTVPMMLRWQMYTPILMGAMGTFYGDSSIFAFESPYGGSWTTALEHQGALDLERYGKLFNSRPWYNLVPDISNLVLTKGVGSPDTSAYASCAITTDGGCAIAYTPFKKDLSINMSKIIGTGVHVWWYNPATGNSSDYGTYANATTINLSPPSLGDWVLVLDNSALNLSAPGIPYVPPVPEPSTYSYSSQPILSHDQYYVTYDGALDNDLVGTWNPWFPTQDTCTGTFSYDIINNVNNIYSINNTSGLLSIGSSTNLTTGTDQVTIRTTLGSITQDCSAFIKVMPIGNCYFIDPSVGSSGTGTRISPYKAWSDSYTHAVGKAYFLKRGSITTTKLEASTNGTLGNEVIYGSYGPENGGTKAFIQRPGLVGIYLYGNYNQFYDLYFNKCGWAIIQEYTSAGYKRTNNLFSHLYAYQTGLINGAIFFQQQMPGLQQSIDFQAHHKVYDYQVTEASGYGMKIEMGDIGIENMRTWKNGCPTNEGHGISLATLANHVVIKGLSSYANTYLGMEMSGSYHDLSYSYIDGSGVGAVSAINLDDPTTHDCSIRHCVIKGTNLLGSQKYAAIRFRTGAQDTSTGELLTPIDSRKKYTIENCNISYAPGNKGTAIGIYNYTQQVLLRNNIIHDCSYGIYMLSWESGIKDVSIYNNIFHSNNSDIYTLYGSSNLNVYNNTATSVFDFTDSATETVKNNVYGSWVGAVSSSSNNLDIDTINQTDYFVDPTNHNYHLKSSATNLIGMGINVGILTDHDGSTYTNPPSIGAYEYFLEPSTYSYSSLMSVLSVDLKYCIPENVSTGDYVGYWKNSRSWVAEGSIRYAIETDPLSALAIDTSSGLMTISDYTKIQGQIATQDYLWDVSIRTTDYGFNPPYYTISKAEIRIKENSYCKFYDPSFGGTSLGTKVAPYKTMNAVAYEAGYGYFVKRDRQFTDINTVAIGGLHASETNPTVFSAYGSGYRPIFCGPGGGVGFYLGTGETSEPEEYVYLYEYEIKSYENMAIKSFMYTTHIGMYNLYIHRNNLGDIESQCSMSTQSYEDLSYHAPLEVLNCDFSEAQIGTILTHSHMKIGMNPITIKSCSFYDNTPISQVRLADGSLGGVVEDCLFIMDASEYDNNSCTHIQLRMNNVVIERNRFSGSTTAIFVTCPGWVIGEDWIYLMQPCDFTIKNNYFDQAREYAINIATNGALFRTSKNVLIENNIITNCNNYGIKASKANNVIIRYNNISGFPVASVAGYSSTGILEPAVYGLNDASIYYNVIYGFKNGIDVAVSSGIGIYNNTVDGSIILTGATNAVARNNFFLRKLTNADTSSNNINIADITVADYFTDYANHDYHLKSTATNALDAGYDMGYIRDLDDVSVNNPPDIGAYEYFFLNDLNILFADDLSTWIVGEPSIGGVFERWPLTRQNWNSGSIANSIVQVNESNVGKAFESTVATGECTGLGNNCYQMQICLGQRYPEVWVDWSMWADPGYDGDGATAGGAGAGKMPAGFMGGLDHLFGGGDPCTRSGEAATGWHTHPVWGSTNNLMSYTYDLQSAARTGAYINNIPIGGWERWTARCKVNTPGVSNGFIEYFVNSLYKCGQYDIMMRSTEQYNADPSYGYIEAVWLSNFFGGGGSTFASKRNNTMRFSNIVISEVGAQNERYKDSSSHTGDTIPSLYYSGFKNDISILFNETFTAESGVIQSHYNVDTPPMSYRTYTKTIISSTATINLIWDYYRYDFDYGANNSWCKVYKGVEKTLVATYDRTNLASGTDAIDSSVCIIDYFIGNNVGDSKGWKLHYTTF